MALRRTSVSFPVQCLAPFLPLLLLIIRLPVQYRLPKKDAQAAIHPPLMWMSFRSPPPPHPPCKGRSDLRE